MKVLKVASIWVFCAAWLSSCGDKNLVEYNRDRVNQEVSRMETIAGSYSGDLVLKADGKTRLGQIKIDLKAATKVAPASSDPSNTQQASLEGLVGLMISDPINLSFTNGFFDVNNGHFQLSITVQRRNSENIRIEVSGKAEKNQLIGEIFVAEFRDRAAQFSIPRVQPEPLKSNVLNDVSVATKGQPPEAWTAETVLGGDPVTVDLVMQPASANDLELAIQLFVPTQLKNISLLFGGTKRYWNIVSYTNAIWDYRKGVLRGENSTENSSMDCLAVRLKDGAQGWKCSYYKNGVSLTDMLFSPKGISP